MLIQQDRRCENRGFLERILKVEIFLMCFWAENRDYFLKNDTKFDKTFQQKL